MNPRTALAVGAAVVLSSLALDGCASTAPLDTAAVTCAPFLEFTRDNQDRVISEATAEAEYAFYSAAGAVSVTPWQYLQLTCAMPANAGLSVEQALAITVPPTCDHFLTTPDQVRREWAKLRSSTAVDKVDGESVSGSQWDDDSTMESLTTACLAGGTLDAAMSHVENHTTPPPYAFDHGYDFGLSHKMTWTTTSRLGVLVAGSLELGDDVLGGVDPSWGPHGNSLITVGEGCGYDPNTDAVIAGRIVAINRSDSPAQISVGFNVTHDGSGDTAVEIDSGSYCDTEGDYGYAGLVIQSGNTNLVAPGETYPIAFFIILRNYFSPAHPTGARGELADYIVTPFGASTNDDDWIAIAPQEVSLSLDVMGTAAVIG